MAMKNITAGGVIMVVMIAIAGLYLFDQFTSKDTSGSYQFEMPSNLDTPVLWLIKLAIVGGMTVLALWVFTKATKGALTRKDIMTYVIVGVAVYFAWEYIAGPLFHATSIQGIAWKFGKATRLIP